MLANFLLSKNTSRHFKRSEQKKNVTKDTLLVEKELLMQRLKPCVSLATATSYSSLLNTYVSADVDFSKYLFLCALL